MSEKRVSDEGDAEQIDITTHATMDNNQVSSEYEARSLSKSFAQLSLVNRLRMAADATDYADQPDQKELLRILECEIGAEGVACTLEHAALLREAADELAAASR